MNGPIAPDHDDKAIHEPETFLPQSKPRDEANSPPWDCLVSGMLACGFNGPITPTIALTIAGNPADEDSGRFAILSLFSWQLGR